jgi:hypothetical protein
MSRLLIGALAAVALSGFGGARAESVDWKWYGGAPLGIEGIQYCFYDALSVAKTPPDNVRVWAKCLPKNEVESLDSKTPLGKAVIQAAGAKIAHYYVPPIAKVESINSDQATSITIDEVAADMSYIKSGAMIFYELDCRQRKERELSMTIGDSVSNDPLEWKYVPPEGNIASLVKLLCPLG